MTDPESLVARLDVIEARLAAHTDSERPGLTRADEGTGERWGAAQVWAHLAEFPAYWVGQIRAILAARAGGEPEPIPFGRTKADPGRAAASEAGRRARPPAAPQSPTGPAPRRSRRAAETTRRRCCETSGPASRPRLPCAGRD